jgi:hypothetical protein
VIEAFLLNLFLPVVEGRGMIIVNQTLTALALVGLLLLSSTLPGCLETTDQVLEEFVTDPDAVPIDGMGLWWPIVDGIIHDDMILGPTEWSDSAFLEIEFADSSGLLHPAEFRYKSVNGGLALAVRVDELDVTPDEVIVTLPDRALNSEITTTSTTSDSFATKVEFECFSTLIECPTEDDSKFKLDASLSPGLGSLKLLQLNSIATIYDLDSDSLSMEAKMKQVFKTSSEVEYNIQIVFGDDVWVFEQTRIFDWVIPLVIPRADLTVEGIEVIQAVQTEDMQIPLVKGKESLARVYVDSGLMSTAEVEVTLTACVLNLCFEELKKEHLAVKNPDRNVFSESANFILPEYWVSGDILSLIATVKPRYPAGSLFYVDPDFSNNYEVGHYDLHTTINFAIWVLPSREDNNLGGGTILTGNSRAQSTLEYWMDSTEAVFPVADLEVVYLSPIWGPDFTGVSNSAVNDWARDFDAAWNTLAISATGESAYDQLFVARDGSGRGGLADAIRLSGTSRVSVCDDTGSTSRSLCAAHEITHNIGPNDFDGDGDGFDGDGADEDWSQHLTSCPNSGGNDAVWNKLYGNHYLQTTIKDLGWDTTVPDADTNFTALIPSNYPDYMSYCRAGFGGPNEYGQIASKSDADTGPPWNLPYTTNQTKWISTYRYLILFDKMSDWDRADPPYNVYYDDGDSEADIGRQNQNVRVIKGIAPSDGTNPYFRHSWTFDGALSESASIAHGDYRTEWNYTILAKDSNGYVIDTIRYSPTFEIHESEEELEDDYFSFYVQDNDIIDSIEMLDMDGNMIDSLYSSGTPVTRMHALGTSSFTRDDATNLSWVQSSSTSNRETLYQLEYSWGGGFWLPIGAMTNQTHRIQDFGTIPGGENAKFRIRATNGFDTYYSESSEFSLPNQAPKVTLETSGALGVQIDSSRARIVTQGQSFTFSPSIADPDMEDLNVSGCSAVLKRGEQIVWGSGAPQKNRVTSWLDRELPTTSLEHGPGLYDSIKQNTQLCMHDTMAATLSSHHFPNEDLLPGELIPGDYEFEMTYSDQAGAATSTSIVFTIVSQICDAPIDGSCYTNQIPDALTEYRSNLERPESTQKDLSIDELQYYVELERAARDDDGSLSDAELSILAEELGISVSRAVELEVLTHEN